jgi:hypothetical protein
MLVTLTPRGQATLAWSRDRVQAALTTLGEHRLPEIAATLSELVTRPTRWPTTARHNNQERRIGTQKIRPTNLRSTCTAHT